MYPEPLLARFRAVDALAQRGSPGERDNAQRIVARMETEHPGIRAAAYPRPRSDTAQNATPNAETERPRWRDRWRDMASDAFDWAAHVAQEVISANQARDLADEVCEIQIKHLSSGKWQMALRLDERDLRHAARNLTPLQKIQFVQHILSAMETELLDALT
jgi:hypothetical protein